MLAGLAGGALAWGLVESQRVQCCELEVAVPGLPPKLAGLRILHLSDFHLGSLSLNGRAVRKTVAWARGRRPHLAAVTGDLLSRDRGHAELRTALEELRTWHGVYVSLGNHDVAVTRDPFSDVSEVGELASAGATVLRDESVTLAVDGVRIQVVGVDPVSYMARTARPERLADPDAELRILLCHFPKVVDRVPRGVYHLVLAGHVHGGQICLPVPGGKVTLGEWRPRYRDGVFRLGATTLVVSRGVGTAFVPFRFFAPPEAAELVLVPAP